MDEEQLKKLKRTQNKSGIIYKYIQKEPIESFIDDLKNLS